MRYPKTGPMTVWYGANYKRGDKVHKVLGGNQVFVGTLCGLMYYRGGTGTDEPVNCGRCLAKLASVPKRLSD